MDFSPIRKVTKSSRSIIGKIPSIKNRRLHCAESTLERDFFLLLENDATVEKYIEQPLRIKYTDAGKVKHYVPDVLVFYFDALSAGNVTPPLLCEIKYKKDLQVNYPKYAAKFRAAEAYALENNFQFKVITETEIRTEFLKNLKFLSAYRTGVNPAEQLGCERIKNTMNKLKITTVQNLLNACTADSAQQPEMLFLIWHLIASGWLGCDLQQKLTMNSAIWNNQTSP